MVNTGKPSTGCAVCKQRKIKCDETRPFCNRCRKAHRECPGVPEPQDLAFRVLRWGSRSKDQQYYTAQTQPKDAKNHQCMRSWTTDKSLVVFDGSYESQDSRERERVASTINGELQYPIEHQALCLWLHDYTGRPGDPRLRQRPVFLLQRMFREAGATEPIHYALTACAICILSKYANAPQLRRIGAERYFEGLNALQKAVACPKSRLSDGVLGGIILIKMFEMHTASGDSIDSYFKHTEGAIALIKARGKAQFYDPNALATFRAFRTQMITSAIEGGDAKVRLVSDDFDWFGDRNMPDDTVENTKLMRLAYDICSVRHRISEWLEPIDPTAFDFTLSPSDFDDPSRLFLSSEELKDRTQMLTSFSRELEGIDERLDDWFENLPYEWWPSTVPVTEPRPDVWHGLVYVFQRPLAAAMLSFAHSLRLIVNALHIKTQLRLGLETPVASLFKIRICVDAICATQPFAFGSDLCKLPLKKMFLDPQGWPRANLLFQVIPMYFAAAAGECVPLDQRVWLKERMQTVSDTIHYHAAGVMASSLPF